MSMLLTLFAVAGLALAAWQGPRALEPIPAGEVAPPLVIPEGAVIPVRLITELSSKHAEPGDGVYARTIIPLTADDQIVIPVGSYVQGRVVDAAQAGRVSGRSELTITFHTITLESGITLPIYGSLGGVGGTAERTGEAGVRGESTRGEDAATVGGGAGTGAVVGAAAGRSLGGAAIGAGVGAGVGLTQVLLTRGEDVVLGEGTVIEIVLDRPIER